MRKPLWAVPLILLSLAGCGAIQRSRHAGACGPVAVSDVAWLLGDEVGSGRASQSILGHPTLLGRLLRFWVSPDITMPRELVRCLRTEGYSVTGLEGCPQPLAENQALIFLVTVRSNHQWHFLATRDPPGREFWERYRFVRAYLVVRP